jgi:hypothetical protein
MYKTPVKRGLSSVSRIITTSVRRRQLLPSIALLCHPSCETNIHKRSLSSVAAIPTKKNFQKKLVYMPTILSHVDKRAHACQALSDWFEQDREWQQATIQHLNIARLDDQVKHFYKDSIHSFIERIANPETIQELPSTVNDSVDALLRVGFGDRKTSKHIWRTREFKQHRKKASDDLMIKRAVMQGLQIKLDENTQALARLQDGKAKLPEPPGKALEGLSLKKALKAAKNVFKSETNNTNSNSAGRRDWLTVKRKHDELDTKIQSTTDRIQTLEKKMSSLQHQIDRLLHLPDRFSSPLSDEAFDNVNRVVGAVMGPLCQSFSEHIRERHSKLLSKLLALEARTDLTKPHGWYSHARLYKRKIIYHGGPTNSGKTYAALERLKQAESGMYLGPLRLLAAEVYEKLTAQGVYCSLYTGQEKRAVPFSTHAAGTVELAQLDRDFDVLVIDEIQMIEDPDRGFAWTRALLGSRCKEIHVCGGLEAKDLVERLTKACGDEFELHMYERFSELKVAKRSLAYSEDEEGCYSRVQPGDCVVAFSRNDIFAIRREIESNTKHKCCVIYGTLPPQVRTEQARRFNDPNTGYDVLVSSDAIGMVR